MYSELGRTLKSEGVAYWELLQDTTDIGHYVEIRIAYTWTDNVRQHERVTKNVQIMEDKIKSLLKDGPETNSFSLYRKICFQILHPNF